MFKKINSLLYVEDDDTVRDNISEYFKRNIQNVYIAKDGEEGLDLFNKYLPQVVITDIAMPKVNGIELLQEIRKLSTKTELIITSSFDDQEYLLDAVNLQLMNYILKPLTIVKLEKALKLCERKLPDTVETKIYFCNDIYFDSSKNELSNNSSEILLTVKERQLLELLLKINPAPLTYELIYYHLYDNIQSKDAVKTLIKILRKKVSDTFIETIYGYGYKLNLFNKVTD